MSEEISEKDVLKARDEILPSKAAFLKCRNCGEILLTAL